MTKTPKISKKFLDKIDSVYARATNLYQNINSEAINLVPVKNNSNPTGLKMKR